MPRSPFRTVSTLLLVAMFLLGAALLCSSGRAAEPSPAPEPKTFVYLLRLIPRLHDDKAWTEKDVAIVQRHASRLTAETKARRVILAGRTTEPGDRTFGLVIFEADDEDTARAYMQADPAVAEGIMTATVHPYLIAFQREPISDKP
ncbi:MAG TPA: YciI family protein [Opitutaceae bacterium]